jgi:hypothetical protein
MAVGLLGSQVYFVFKTLSDYFCFDYFSALFMGSGFRNGQGWRKCPASAIVGCGFETSPLHLGIDSTQPHLRISWGFFHLI